MSATISVYNHTAAKFADGSFTATHTYKLKLLSAAVFDATHTTLGETGGTEAATGTGYIAGGQALANVAVAIVAPNGARFDADDVAWTAVGGSITASYGILYNDSVSGAPPLAFINFGGVESAGAGTDFLIIWSANGIFTWTVV